ncbi:hypothetical protein Daus18300_005784 [Diaporthe australafricana]|uniref:Uncharacterized protein n=1 Tax=Diaporthe australafricana TaxID=127596 RepID=A0ABR3WZQ1_9PEZI
MPVAEAGVAIGAANFVAGVPNHTRTWNTTYHDTVDFREKVEQARSDLDACTADFLEWKEIWKYKSAEWNLYASLFLGIPGDEAPADEQRPADSKTPAGEEHPPLDHQTPSEVPEGTVLTASHPAPNHQPPHDQFPINNRPVTRWKPAGRLLAVCKRLAANHVPTQPSIDGNPPARGPSPAVAPEGPTAAQEPAIINAENTTGGGFNADDPYRSLWKEQYKQMSDTVYKVIQGMRGINEHIDRIVNEKKNSPAWKKYLDVPRARYVRNLTYALFSNSSLQGGIAQLKVNIARLKEVSEMRLRKMQGNAVDLKLTGPEAFQLTNLEYFGRKIIQELRGSLPTASAWSLELCHPDIGGSASNWQGLTSVQLWLSYSIPVVGQHNQARHRIIVDYSLEDGPNPPWRASALPGANPAHNPPGNPPRSLPHNPRLAKNEDGTGKLTVPFSNLFRICHGDKYFPAELWAWDQAYLVLSLANWSLLLWTSEWTARWCSSGLHFVQVETGNDEAGKNAFFFPSFSRCASPPGTDVNQGQNHHHSNLKLRNLGLVLAEAICIVPLRVSPANENLYEECDGGRWVPLSVNALLALVEKKAKSKCVRDAVQQCLRSNATFQTTNDKLAAFFKEYVKMIFDPIQKWCDIQQKNYEENIQPNLDDIRALIKSWKKEDGEKHYLWPDDAFHTPREEVQDAGVAAELE